MAVVWMVQAAFNKIVHMLTVPDSRMSAVRSVNMLRRMARGALSARVRVRLVHGNYVFLNVIALNMLQMAFAQIVRVSFVLNCHVSAPGPVMMLLVLMLNAFFHRNPFLREPYSSVGSAQGAIVQPACRQAAQRNG